MRTTLIENRPNHGSVESLSVATALINSDTPHRTQSQGCHRLLQSRITRGKQARLRQSNRGFQSCNPAQFVAGAASSDVEKDRARHCEADTIPLGHRSEKMPAGRLQRSEW